MLKRLAVITTAVLLVSGTLTQANAQEKGATGLTLGFPASVGKVRGRARVMLTAEDLPSIVEDEILVCEATSPNWTPAFAVIAGCVCDGGGSLTHAAIVSREYGIPCVVGCSVATSRIRTGDLVEVDGSTGTITILERAPA